MLFSLEEASQSLRWCPQNKEDFREEEACDCSGGWRLTCPTSCCQLLDTMSPEGLLEGMVLGHYPQRISVRAYEDVGVHDHS